MKHLLENWREFLNEKKNPRVPRKKGQPAKSKKHSDLYTDEDPKGTIHGLGYKDEATARASVAKIRKSNRSHAHKTQAAIAMEQRAKAAGKSKEAAIFRKFYRAAEEKDKSQEQEKMKLLLENWRQYLNEQKEGEGVLLYHATCSPPESFANGIESTRAKGYGQGEGFYFFTKKTMAVNHANNLIKGSVDKEEAVDCSGGAYIVISDEPVTPETFDIDYEAYAGGFAEFVANNREYFEPRKEDYGIIRISDRGFNYFDVDGGERQNRRLFVAVGRLIDRHRAVIISQMAQKLSSEDSEMFKRFEQEILPKSTAIKYNGEEVIYPLRIEDLEGNIVWNRK